MKRKNGIEKTLLGADDSFKQIGLTLKCARRLHGHSIKEVSEQLRISVDYLSKLEAGAFQDLPAPAYVNGFLRSYGKHLDLVPDSLVARYAALATANDTKPCHRMPMTTRPPQRSAPAVASMLVVFAAVAYGGWFWINGDTEGSLSTMIGSNDIEQPLKRNAIVILDASIDDYSNAPSDDLGGEIKDPETVIDLGTATLDLDGKPFLNGGQPPVTTKILQTKSVLAMAKSQEMSTSAVNSNTSILSQNMLGDSPKPLNSARSGQFEETQILSAPFSDITDIQNSSTAVANLRDPTQEITIRAVASSWVEIVRDNGEGVLAKLMQAGDVYVVEGNTRLYLSTGNAGGLTVLIGGDDPVTMGGIGEIVRDLPLVTDKLRNLL